MTFHNFVRKKLLATAVLGISVFLLKDYAQAADKLDDVEETKTATASAALQPSSTQKIADPEREKALALYERGCIIQSMEDSIRSLAALLGEPSPIREGEEGGTLTLLDEPAIAKREAELSSIRGQLIERLKVNSAQ